MHFPIQPKDQFDISPLSKADVQIFNAISTNWQTWVKPKGVTMCYMFAVGGGGGGGGGQSGGNSGGGGGGCSAISRLIVPAFFLPENLFVQVGLGGQGGAINTNGSAGGTSYISLGRNTTIPSLVLASNVTQPGGGTSGGGGRTGGTASTAFAGSAFTGLGHFTATAVTTTGGAGGQAAAGTSITPWQTAAANNFVLSPGAGGCGNVAAGTNGGAQNNGTNALDLSFLGLVAASTAILNGGVTAATGNAGPNGIKRLTPFMQTGGCGGGYATTTTGGRGGDGGYGCGGGGGAAGATTGAAGGNGGDGLVMIISW